MINKVGSAPQTSPVEAAAENHNPFLAVPPPPHHLHLHLHLTPWDDHSRMSHLHRRGVVDGNGKPNLCETLKVKRMENNLAPELDVDSWSHQIIQQVSTASSPKSCVTNLDFFPKSSGLKHPSSQCNDSTDTGGAAKKARIQEASSPNSNFKVRKEKLGDRITALHQIVSPFGKTDTASVLLEVIGYIRFLQNQIEALSLPYMDNRSEARRPDPDKLKENPRPVDLWSRGLCLVPIACTLDVNNDVNGADSWASTFGPNFG